MATKAAAKKGARLAGSPASPAEREPDGIRGKMAAAPHRTSDELEAAYAVMEAAAKVFLAASGVSRYVAAKKMQMAVGPFYRVDRERRRAGAA